MIETLYGAHNQDKTRIKRAFGWVVTFRDFPMGSWQTVEASTMMTDALTLFTKGRAEFYLDGERRRDRVPGVLSSEEPYDFTQHDGQFKLVYVEPTSRVCVPAKINGGKLPTVSKRALKKGDLFEADGKYLVALGAVSVNKKIFNEEQTFRTSDRVIATALEESILLQFHDSPR